MGPQDCKRLGIEVDELWNNMDEWRARLAARALPSADQWVYVVLKPASTPPRHEISISLCGQDTPGREAVAK